MERKRSRKQNPKLENVAVKLKQSCNREHGQQKLPLKRLVPGAQARTAVSPTETIIASLRDKLAKNARTKFSREVVSYYSCG